MTNLVRVSVECSTGKAHVTMPEGVAKRLGLTPLKQAAVGRDGRALPAKYPPRKATAAPTAGSQENPSGSGDAASDKEEKK